MKKLIIKYSIEFFVIVFSISVSFFVDNIREEIEKDKKRTLIKTSLLQEIKSFEKALKYRLKAFKGDHNSVLSVLNEKNNIDSVFNNMSDAGFGNAFFLIRLFEPPNTIYNSLVNDGDINLIKSRRIKSLLQLTYAQSPKAINDWIEGERIIADRIEMHIIDNYPKFYNKEIYTKTDKSIVKEFLSILDSDEKLKALIKSKEQMMWWKKYILEDFYTKYRDSLIIELEKELKDN
jgi:hypothetical protein